MNAVSHARRWGLQERVCCPHCWERFAPEQCLWISQNPALRGDERLGAEQQRRFRPDRFTAEGDAIDTRGSGCQDLACPNCHLGVPRACLEMQPMFLSIIGAPGSGKSVYLGAMAAELRQLLTRDFCLSFADADPEMNAAIIGYESNLSQLTNPAGQKQQVVAIAAKVLKTDPNAFTDKVKFDSGDFLFPRPMVFTVQPTQGHTNEPKSRHFARCVCLYDNAGESFEAGRDTVLQPYTRHLAQAQALFVVIDLTQDADFQKQMRQAGCDPRAFEWTRRQDDYIHEAARRIRKFARMRETDKFRSPLIVVLTKCDAWWPVLGVPRPGNPWVRPAGARFSALDVSAIQNVSQLCAQRLRQTCPRVTNALEGFANDIVYVPVSATGWNTTFDAKGKPAIRQGEDEERHWPAVPFLYALRRIAPNLMAEIKRKG